jgi:3-isopropylmalate dehydrogenase
MSSANELQIAVFPGDGIGPEVTSSCLELLDLLAEIVGGFKLHYEMLEAGAELYQRTGIALSDESIRRAEQADAVLLGAMGLPDVRYPDGTEIAPQIDLRETFHLYAGVRPVKAIPGLPQTLADPRARDIDLVLVRESTEGLFAARGKTELIGNEAARDTMEITRPVSERLFDFAFRLAGKRKSEGRPGIVTCVDKANVLGAFAFFRWIFIERAEMFPDIEAQTSYVDAMGLNLVKRPWDFDVLVTENMFGDILSDVGAGLVGGMGMAPSADIGEEHAVFQPCHGTAPDIAGQGKSNPTAMFLSAAMMLDWLGDRHDLPACRTASNMLTASVEAAFSEGTLLPFEMGGDTGTEAITRAVMDAARPQKIA